MRALSIRQPWAWCILNAGKDIENRQWTTLPEYRGPLLIHASNTMTRIEYEDARAWIRDQIGISVPPREQLARGGIVGVVNFVEVIDARMRIPARSLSRWFVGPVGLVLAQPKLCEFIPLKGQLGIFETGIKYEDLRLL